MQSPQPTPPPIVDSASMKFPAILSPSPRQHSSRRSTKGFSSSTNPSFHSSPRTFLKSMSSEIKPNPTIEKITALLEKIEKNENYDLTQRNKNCCVFPNDFALGNAKSHQELKFMRREYPAYTSSDKQFFSQLIHQLLDAIAAVNNRYQNYCPTNSVEVHQLDGLTSELDMLFTLFDECICQMAPKSRAIALSMKTLYEIFQNYFGIFINRIKDEKEKIKKIKQQYTAQIASSKDDTPAVLPRLQNKVESQNSEIGRLKRELQKTTEENEKLHVEVFRYKAEVTQTQKDINGLLNVNQSLRDTISQNDQKFKQMKQAAPQPAQLSKSFGAVPVDVTTIWTQSSEFLEAIKTDFLDKIDLNKVMPERPTNSSPSLFINFPTGTSEDITGIHFTNFYKVVAAFSEGIDPNKLSELYQNKFRQFVTKISKFYFTRISNLSNKKEEIIKKYSGQVAEMKRAMPDPGAWMKIVIENYSLFASSKKVVDISEQIDKVLTDALKMMNRSPKPTSVSEIVQKCFEQNGTDLLQFLSQIGRQAALDLHIDMFMKFLLSQHSFKSFLFYCTIYLKRNDNNILAKTFEHYGWNSIPNDKKELWNTNYLQLSLPIFAVALYEKALENISVSLQKYSGNDMKSTILNLTGLDMDKAYDEYDYCQAIAVGGKPTIKDLAAVMFRNHVMFETAISDFTDENNQLCEYITSFVVKKKGKKGKK
ncbi:hypothetical protein TRFO_25984 [Tritrichomonas foetus]|uniref:Uncharacterized protein n=1 Tax=Tritrichomonas foetus TaxID=1144522 RepID=A0A1J4K404_9EUKA|nr:hypothetical protein TRFO_25984 [Tritrichomonas foetus]|eukprot:OHT06119.1 hypothetical protein TRFO_25984 [Tritrichomonas foetus]